MFSKDLIGHLGEWIVAVALTHPVGGKYNRPLFRPVFLGEKYPTADLFVDILDKRGYAIGFFFVQVRATMESKSSTGRLPIKLELDRYDHLRKLPIPAFVVGVEITKENAFILAASKPRETGISSITTVFSLRDDEVKIRLYQEVRRFWRRRARPKIETEFIDDEA